MILLVFRPVIGESHVNVRGTYFRICEDATLRGPDNSIAANYRAGLWQLGCHRHRSFECSGPFDLRVMYRDGSHQRTGPYDFVQAIDGALITQTGYLGSFARPFCDLHSTEVWREVAFLPAVPGAI